MSLRLVVTFFDQLKVKCDKAISRLFVKKQLERLTFPYVRAPLCFNVGLQQFECKMVEHRYASSTISLQGGTSGLGGLYVDISEVYDGRWRVTFQFNGGTSSVINYKDFVNHT